MSGSSPETTPVIVGIGELVDRPANPADALEPLALMVEALRAANADGGGGLLQRVESIELIASVTWRYADPVSQLCQRLGIDPIRKVHASGGGETPTRLIHEAAMRIARGEQQVAAIVGGEAMNARTRARKDKVQLNWTPPAAREDTTKFPSSGSQFSPVAKKLGLVDPAQVYPLYEMAAQAAWGQTPEQAQAESARLWAQYAIVASQNPCAWNKKAPSAEAIATVDEDNRMICWPYPKWMVANPQVNQSAAVIVASLGSRAGSRCAR